MLVCTIFLSSCDDTRQASWQQGSRQADWLGITDKGQVCKSQQGRHTSKAEGKAAKRKAGRKGARDQLSDDEAHEGRKFQEKHRATGVNHVGVTYSNSQVICSSNNTVALLE